MAKLKPNKEITAYDKTVQMNKDLGLRPRTMRYSVAGEGFYGLYDNYLKLQSDLDEMGLSKTKINTVVHTEPDRNTYKAYNNTFKCFIKINGTKYRTVPITSENSNTIIFPERERLFTHV